MMIYLKPLQEHRQGQYQPHSGKYKAGLTSEKPELDEKEQVSQDTWDEQSLRITIHHRRLKKRTQILREKWKEMMEMKIRKSM